MTEPATSPTAFSRQESRKIRELLSNGKQAPPCPRCGNALRVESVEIGRKIKLIPFTPVATIAGTRWHAWCQVCHRAAHCNELPGGRWVDLAE